MKLSIRTIFIAVLASGLTASVIAAVTPVNSALFPEAQWKKIRETHGITLAQWFPPDSQSVAFRADTEIDSPIAKVISVIKDTSRRPEWSPNVKTAKVLRTISKTEWVEYWHLATPIIIKDRELILAIKVDFDNESKKVIATFRSVDDENAPKTGRIRANLRRGSYQIWPSEDGTKTQLIYQAHIELGGTVPTWITNEFGTGFPIDTMRALSKQSRRSDVTPYQSVERLFNGQATSAEEVL